MHSNVSISCNICLKDITLETLKYHKFDHIETMMASKIKCVKCPNFEGSAKQMLNHLLDKPHSFSNHKKLTKTF